MTSRDRPVAVLTTAALPMTRAAFAVGRSRAERRSGTNLDGGD